jgi:Rrf2 family protein
MKFSSQEEYGLRCLKQVGHKGVNDSITIVEISRREGLTEPYVAKLLMILRKGGFINSTRGQSGGYSLARVPEEINIGEVLSLLGGRLYEDTFCERHASGKESCANSDGCSIKSLWNRVQDAVDQVVNNMTLAELIAEDPEQLIQLQDPKNRFASKVEVHA